MKPLKIDRDTIRKALNKLNKKQIVAIGTLVILPGGIPIMGLYLYSRYKDRLKSLKGYTMEIVHRPSKCEKIRQSLSNSSEPVCVKSKIESILKTIEQVSGGEDYTLEFCEFRSDPSLLVLEKDYRTLNLRISKVDDQVKIVSFMEDESGTVLEDEVSLSDDQLEERLRWVLLK